MSRRVYTALLLGASLLAVSVPVAVLGGIWLGSWKLIGTAFVLMVCAIPSGLFVADLAVPERNLPRHHRRQLRAEQARIRMEAAIADAEREAGIR